MYMDHGMDHDAGMIESAYGRADERITFEEKVADLELGATFMFLVLIMEGHNAMSDLR